MFIYAKSRIFFSGFCFVGLFGNDGILQWAEGSYRKISMPSLTSEPIQGFVSILERDFLPHD
jgi:hypothetical protein